MKGWTMVLRVIYRSYGGENNKGRPEWYSKSVALQSMLRAVAAAECEIVFLNNGPIESALVTQMCDFGEIVDLPNVGMRRSFLAALQLPLERGWAADDIVYFAEDDYLHHPDALTHLRAAADQLPADYFALYGRYKLTGEQHDVWSWSQEAADCGQEPKGWNPFAPLDVDGHTWARLLATTATFGARVHALRTDLSIFKQVGLPHRRIFRDRDMCLAYQGYEPHRWGQLARDASFRGGGGLRSRVRAAALAPFKAAMNVRSHRRPGNRHVLMGAAPNLATHLEVPFLAPDEDWSQVARDAIKWADTRRVRNVVIPRQASVTESTPA